MSPSTETTDATEAGEEPRRRWSLGVVVQLSIIVLLVLGWGAIFTWTVLTDAYDPPDQLVDRLFPIAAEPICAATVAEIEALGLPTEVESPAERAELVIDENELLRAMLDDLEGLDRPGGQEGEWVTLWLQDWSTHIDDRQAWADDLQAGDDHLFEESDRAGEQVSKVIDNFAEVNEMESCATPGDV